MRRLLTSLARWMGRGWALIGIALLAFVVLEAMYRTAWAVRNRGGDSRRPATPALASQHPYADQRWFDGWYEQPVVRGGIVYDPYRAFHKAPAQTSFVTIDSAGRRRTVQSTARDSARRTVYLLGGSTMWGYTVRDSFTIPSLVARELRARGITDVEVLNLAQPGYNATQEVLSLLLALRDGERPSAAVFLTTHKDIYAAFQAGRPGGITSEGVYASMLEPREPSFSENVRAIARRSALVRRFSPPPRAMPATYTNDTPDPALCGGVAAQYRELARITSALGKEYGFPFFFLRQPMLASSRKPLTAWEREMRRPRYEALYLQCMAQIDSTMARVAGGSYQSLAGLFDRDSTSVFLDEYGYLTEQAGSVVARRIAELVEPALRRSRTAVR